MQSRNQLIIGVSVVASCFFIGGAGMWSISGRSRAVPTVTPAPTALPVRTARPTPTSVPPAEPTLTPAQATRPPVTTIEAVVRAPTIAPTLERKSSPTRSSALNASASVVDHSYEDLPGRDFSGQNLVGANFEHTDLRGASFANADLSGAHFYTSLLSGVNFHGANLEGADLTWTSLAGADLSDARLEGARLEGANLDGALIQGTILVGSKGRDTTAQRVVPPTLAPPPSPTARAIVGTAPTYLDPRELTADPRAFIGKYIILYGKASNVQVGLNSLGQEYTWVALEAQVRNKSSTESIVVKITPKVPTFLKEECYMFYGIVRGTTMVIRSLTGAQNEVPEVESSSWKQLESDRFGNCLGI